MKILQSSNRRCNQVNNRWCNQANNKWCNQVNNKWCTSNNNNQWCINNPNSQWLWFNNLPLWLSNLVEWWWACQEVTLHILWCGQKLQCRSSVTTANLSDLLLLIAHWTKQDGSSVSFYAFCSGLACASPAVSIRWTFTLTCAETVEDLLVRETVASLFITDP